MHAKKLYDDDWCTNKISRIVDMYASAMLLVKETLLKRLINYCIIVIIIIIITIISNHNTLPRW